VGDPGGTDGALIVGELIVSRVNVLVPQNGSGGLLILSVGIADIL